MMRSENNNNNKRSGCDVFHVPSPTTQWWILIRGFQNVPCEKQNTYRGTYTPISCARWRRINNYLYFQYEIIELQLWFRGETGWNPCSLHFYCLLPVSDCGESPVLLCVYKRVCDSVDSVLLVHKQVGQVCVLHIKPLFLPVDIFGVCVCSSH